MLTYRLFLDHLSVYHRYLKLRTAFRPLCAPVSFISTHTCSSCNATYYGKTSRDLKVRYMEHLGINRSGHKTKSSSQSSIGDHITKTAHNGTMEDFKISARSDNTFDLLIYKSLLIQKDRPIFNSQQSSIPLVLFYVVCFLFQVASSFPICLVFSSRLF